MTFTDDFNRSDENLETSTNWTRVGGAAGAAGVRSNQLAILSTTDTAYQCPDQGDADHYTQAVRAHGGNAAYFECAIRTTDQNNFIGIQMRSSDAFKLYKRDTGSFTQLGTNGTPATTNDVGYVEGNGNSITAKLNGTTEVGPITETFNNAETRQGLVVRSTLDNPCLDDFEAGTLVAGVTVAPTTGEFTWNGVAPTATKIKVQAPQAGEIVWEGTTPTVTTEAVSTQSPQTGEMVWDNTTPTTFTIKAAVPGVGEIVWQGATPTVTTGVTKTLTPQVGEFTWEGGTPTVAYRVVTQSPTTGEMAWVGATPTVTKVFEAAVWRKEARVTGNWTKETKASGTWTKEDVL